jgi:hypothetical protein
MPADAVFESQAAYAACVARLPNNNSLLLSHSGNTATSTTKSFRFVVENQAQKAPLKVLVESLLLAFCAKCRRADIFFSRQKREGFSARQYTQSNSK